MNSYFAQMHLVNQHGNLILKLVNGTTSYLTLVYQLCIYVALIIQLKSYFLYSSRNMRFNVKGDFEGDFGENLGVIALI